MQRTRQDVNEGTFDVEICEQLLFLLWRELAALHWQDRVEARKALFGDSR